MSAGRMMLYDKRGSLRDKTSRVLIRLPGERELRLREFGTKQAAWIKLLTLDGLEAEPALRRSARRPGRTRPRWRSCWPSPGRCTRCCATSR